MYYCGWDGGGSKTEVSIIDQEGVIISEASFGALNPNGASIETVNKTIENCIAFMKSVITDLNNCNDLVIGLAGISNKNTAVIIENAVRNYGYIGSLKLLGDHEIALAGAIENQGGILIAGTGSICLCRNENGEIFRCGGYGHLIDDEGSGYAIGRDIVKSIVYASDGRGDKTILKDLVFNYLNISYIPELITWLYSESTAKKDVASLAPLLINGLNNCDSVSINIAQKAAKELAFLLISAFRKANIANGEIALMGSIFKYYDYIKSETIKILENELTDAKIIKPKLTASQGAAKLAKENFNI